MGLFDKVKRVGSALKLAGDLISPPRPRPANEFIIGIALKVRADDVDQVRQAIDIVNERVDRFGTGMLSKLLGISDDIVIEDIQAGITSEVQNAAEEEACRPQEGAEDSDQA